MDQCRYFYVLSFTARNSSGIAIVIASDEREAFMCLKNSGMYNGSPNEYTLNASRNVGHYDGSAYGLMLESYTNAKVAYDAIAALIPNDLNTLESRIKKYVDDKLEEALKPDKTRVVYTFSL